MKIRLAAFLLSAGLLMTASFVQAQSGMEIAVSRFNTSLTRESEGKISDALGEMNAAYTAARDDYLVNLRLGWLNYLNKNYDESLRFYRDAARLAGDRSVEAMLGLTLPLAAKEDWVQVEATYLKILRIDVCNYTANLKLGQIYLSRGNYDSAARYLSVALERYPGEYEANLSAGWNNVYLGKSDLARTCFERALMLSPGDTSAARGLEKVK